MVSSLHVILLSSKKTLSYLADRNKTIHHVFIYRGSSTFFVTYITRYCYSNTKIQMDVVVLLNQDGGASTSSSTTNVVALYYPLVKLLHDAPQSEVTRPYARDDT